jgi:hypothetical protein
MTIRRRRDAATSSVSSGFLGSSGIPVSSSCPRRDALCGIKGLRDNDLAGICQRLDTRSNVHGLTEAVEVVVAGVSSVRNVIRRATRG